MSDDMCVFCHEARRRQQGGSDNEEDAACALKELRSKPRMKPYTRNTANAVSEKSVWKRRAQALRGPHGPNTRPRQDYAGEIMFSPGRRGRSFKNQVIMACLQEAHDREYATVTMAPEGEPCAYGGVKTVKVHPESSLAFARLLLKDCFDFDFDEEMFLEGDPHLGLDKEDRQAYKDLQSTLPDRERTTSKRGYQGRNYSCFQNAMTNTSFNTLGLKIDSTDRTSLWSDWLLGKKQAKHMPKEKVKE